MASKKTIKQMTYISNLADSVCQITRHCRGNSKIMAAEYKTVLPDEKLLTHEIKKIQMILEGRKTK